MDPVRCIVRSGRTGNRLVLAMVNGGMHAPDSRRFRACRRGLACAALLVLGGSSLLGGHDLQAAPPRAEAPSEAWLSSFEREHKLSGRIWRTGTRSFVDVEMLMEAAGRADFVLLGEKHDNPDHHRLESAVVETLIRSGRHPAIAFEMFTADQSPALDAYLAAHPRDAVGIAAAIGWDERGWSPWPQYRPIAQAALDAGLPVVAADLARQTIRDVARTGPAALDPAFVARLALDRPLEPQIEDAMELELKMSHCNLLSDEAARRMAFVLRARDAYMADRLVAARDAASADSAVLVSGFGHARSDRGVPWQLARLAPGRTTVAIALIEVSAERPEPGDYAEILGATALPFDFVWFTPRADLDDPCASNADQLRQMKN
jgi:uncharacterized iron-regulated protein